MKMKNVVIKVREVRIVKDVKRSDGLFRLWRYFSLCVDFDHRSYFVTIANGKCPRESLLFSFSVFTENMRQAIIFTSGHPKSAHPEQQEKNLLSLNYSLEICNVAAHS